MAVQSITYGDKTQIYANNDVADANKVKADDMNEIKSVVNDNYTILEGLFYKVNDTFAIQNKQDALVLAGYVSGGQKTLAFTVVCDRSLKNITTITPTTLKANVRGANSYLFTGSYTDGGYNLLSGTSSIQCWKMTDNLIGLQIAYTNTITNSVNNSTVNVSLRDFEFTLT